MKALTTVTCAVFAFASLAARAGTPIINLSIGGEISPGVYGQVQFGNAPPPPVVYPQPTLVVQEPPGVRYEPIYLHVPPRHAAYWAKYCHRYNACDRPVYFVRSAEYEPGYRGHPERGHGGEGRGEHREGRGERRGEGHQEHRD
jgi:hypothetical protein